MFAGVPVMVICRSDEPSMALAILICAPDICRISFILVPWRPIIQPISCEGKRKSQKKNLWAVLQRLDSIIDTFNEKGSVMGYVMIWGF